MCWGKQTGRIEVGPSTILLPSTGSPFSVVRVLVYLIEIPGCLSIFAKVLAATLTSIFHFFGSKHKGKESIPGCLRRQGHFKSTEVQQFCKELGRLGGKA